MRHIQEIKTKSCCPISHEIMEDPVLCSDGHTYERTKIEEWPSPLINLALETKDLIPNRSVRDLIRIHVQQMVCNILHINVSAQTSCRLARSEHAECIVYRGERKYII